MSQKIAAADHVIHGLIQERWSPRAFTSDPVAPAQLASLFEAARWAASGGNGQPWSFIVAPQEDRETFDLVVETLADGNRVWAQHAPVLIVAVAQVLREPGKPNNLALYDLGQAVALLSIQATALGLQVHQMGGFSADRARELFGIPEGHLPATVIAVGAVGDPEALPENLRVREVSPRVRKPLASFVFGRVWGETAAVLQDRVDQAASA
jgi:nitroreductase